MYDMLNWLERPVKPIVASCLIPITNQWVANVKILVLNQAAYFRSGT